MLPWQVVSIALLAQLDDESLDKLGIRFVENPLGGGPVEGPGRKG
jgi:hypothetical protein